MFKELKEKIKRALRGFGFNFKWFSGENFKLFEASFFETGFNIFTFMHVQIAKFIFSIHYDKEV